MPGDFKIQPLEALRTFTVTLSKLCKQLVTVTGNYLHVIHAFS